MDLAPFVDSLRRDLVAAAEVAGEQGRAAADRLVGALDPAVRLALMDALAAAAEEITAEMAPGSVELRLRGREPQFVVTFAPALDPPAPPPGPPTADPDDGAQARISLRLPDSLKGRIEEVANTIGVSVNSWLVRALTDAVTNSHRDGADRRSARRGGFDPARPGRGNSLSGWAR